MSHAPFVHLRVHTAYSLSEGAIRVKDLVKLCQDHAMPAVAITDTTNMFGSLEFSDACIGGGIQPIVGCQMAIARPADADGRSAPGEPDQLVLLAKDEAGHENLVKLTSRAFLATDPGETPRIAWADLETHAEGLIALTGGPHGPINRMLADSRADAAAELLARLKTLFGDRLYVELQRHGLPVEAQTEPKLLDLAYEMDVPLVATNDVYFADEAMYPAQDALLCIAGSTYIGTAERRRLTPDHRFLSAKEMQARFADLPEAIDNTLAIARRCAVRSPKRSPILPNAFDDDRSEDEILRQLAAEGLEKRLADHVWTAEDDEAARADKAKPYRERLAFELDVIEQMGFPGYFLIVADFIQWSKGEGIPVGPGRGSGAGSCVAWALTITDLDPLRWGLLFERFLNPERVSMPDFDIDFCQDRRDETIRYVQDKYGHDKVAQIITFGKLQARAALRDVGRVLQLPFGLVDKMCKLVPNNPANPVTLGEAIAGEPKLQEAAKDEETADMIDIALKLEGLYRHASTHAAGVVIGDRPLDALVPLYRDPKSDMPVTQYSMKHVEPAGLVKFDFLGLKTLTVLARAVDLIERHRGIAVDLDHLPLDDAKTFELLGRGDTVGVFQLESAGMRDVLRKMKPDTFEDIIAIVSLYRPGPMDNIPSYIRRKQGKEKPDYLHDTIKPILTETFGIMIYQEQVMQIAQEMAGYSLGEADLLRRAMGKKIAAEMEKQRVRFVDGSTARGIPEAKAKEVFELMAKFASYGFNKSHAAAYALIAYQTGWLKANHPVEFMAASMQYDLGNTDKLNVFRQDLDRLGIALIRPDINRSDAAFDVDPNEGTAGAVIYALGAIKGVGAGAMQDIVAERRQAGPFTSLQDFASRVDPKGLNRRQLEILACAGAFDELEKDRALVFHNAERVLKCAVTAKEDRESDQVGLFGGGNGGEGGAVLKFEPVPHDTRVNEWLEHQTLQKEHDAIGFFLSGHPLDAYAVALKRLGVTPIRAVGKLYGSGGQSKFTIAGSVVSKAERRTKDGKKFARVDLTDQSGSIEVALFDEVFHANRDLLEAGAMLILRVSAKGDGEAGMRLMADEVTPLQTAAANASERLDVTLEATDAVAELEAMLSGAGRGRGVVHLHVRDPDKSRVVHVELGTRHAVTPDLRARIDQLPGIAKVELV